MSANDCPVRSQLALLCQPDILEYILSNSKYGPRSYTWAARQYSPELYHTWLRQQVEKLEEDDDIYSMIFHPCFSVMINPSSHVVTVLYFDGVCWTINGSLKRFLEDEMGSEFAQSERSINFIKNLKAGLLSDSKLIISHAKLADARLTFEGLVTPSGTIYLEEDGFVVKPSLPDDFQFCQTKISLEDLSWETSEVQQVMIWLKQAFCDPSVIRNFLDHLRTAITSKPDRMIWHGLGQNSKHCMKHLVVTVFGDFFSENEPENYFDRLTIGYVDCDAYDIIITDELPDKFPDRDEVYFSGRWADVADLNNGVFLKDPDFMVRVPSLAPAFLWILTRLDIFDHLN